LVRIPDYDWEGIPFTNGIELVRLLYNARFFVNKILLDCARHIQI